VISGTGGAWQEYAVVPARQVVPVPPEIADDQAASFFVNPASAVVMTRYRLKLRPGDWLLQTAAGGALGRMVIALGRRYGFRTVNVVRRREQGEELRNLGADAVVCTADESIEERALALTGGAGVRCALDAVGGATGSAALRALGPGGRLVVYGTLSEEPLSVPPRLLMAGDRRVEAFWLSNWVARQGPLTMLRLFRQVRRLLADGVLRSDVGAAFPLDQVREAVREADRPGKRGKVLLRMGAARG
jgi:NADPH:quinone reductase-like Zn-dependent oxidoreductase